METTTDLANSIGLGTRQDAAFKGMPLTNFANKEYQINANNAKLEAERKRKEAELERELMSKINITGKFDKIAAPQIQRAYANMVRTKGYSNPEAKYQFDIMKQNHELASAARKEQSDLLNKSDLLIDPKVKAALISHDTPQLELLSKDPNSGVVKDEQLPDTYTLAPEARIPRVPNITMEVKKYIPTDEASLDRSQTKLIKTVGGKNIYGTPIKESVLNQAATEVLSNPMLAKNWLAVHQDEIGKEVSKGVPLQQALINSFKDKNRFIETDTYTPSKEKNNSGVWINQEGQVESKSGWTATPDENKGFLLNTKSPSGVGSQLIRVKKVKKGDIVQKDGKPYQTYKLGNEVDVMLTPSSIKYLGGDKWELKAMTKEGKDNETFEVATQSLKSVIGEAMTQDLKKQSGDKNYPFVKTSNFLSSNSQQPNQTAQPVTAQSDTIKALTTNTLPIIPSDTNRTKKPLTALQKKYGPNAVSTMSKDKGREAYIEPPQNKVSIHKKYNINSYATDPSHEKIVDSIYLKLKEPTVENLDDFIKRNAKGSPISGAMVKNAADKHGVDPNALLAIIHADSTVGTKGKGARTKNAGNVGNTDDGSTKRFATWEDGLEAAAAWLKKHEKSAAKKLEIKASTNTLSMFGVDTNAVKSNKSN